MGNKHNFTIGRCMLPSLVRMVTTRTLPSLPGWVWIILPSSHLEGGKLSSRIIASCPVSILGWAVVHLVLCCKLFIYSLDHLFQKDWCMCCKCCQRVRVEVSCSSKLGSGMALIAEPIIKCPGVRAYKSSGLLLSGVKGLEFSEASIWLRTVVNSS